MSETGSSLLVNCAAARDEGGLAPRRWWYVLPLVFITYSLAYLDRANFAFASAGGMAQDLGISATSSSLIGALFFLGYFFFQIPGAIYAQRRSVRKLIFVSLILWGAAATLTGVISNLGWLYVIRFVLGAVEAAVFPAMLIYLTNWFTRTERSRANTLLLLGNPITVLWMSILSGYLVQNFGWRGMFIIEGLPAVLWAFAWWALSSESPADARWMSAGEKTRLMQDLARDQAALKAVRNYREAFCLPEVIRLSVLYFSWSVGVYGFVLWLPSILKTGSSIGLVQMGWLSAVPYLAAIIAMLIVSHYSDRNGRRGAFVWPALLIAALAFAGLRIVGPGSFWISFFFLTIAGAAMYAPYGPFFALIPEILPKNVAGGATALINSFGALGGFAGSFMVGYLNSRTGGPQLSYLMMTTVLLTAAAIMKSGGFSRNPR